MEKKTYQWGQHSSSIRSVYGSQLLYYDWCGERIKPKTSFQNLFTGAGDLKRFITEPGSRCFVGRNIATKQVIFFFFSPKGKEKNRLLLTTVSHATKAKPSSA
jgi:hypothetical protein